MISANATIKTSSEKPKINIQGNMQWNIQWNMQRNVIETISNLEKLSPTKIDD